MADARELAASAAQETRRLSAARITAGIRKQWMAEGWDPRQQWRAAHGAGDRDVLRDLYQQERGGHDRTRSFVNWLAATDMFELLTYIRPA